MEGRANLVAGIAVEIAPGVRRLIARNAGMMTGPGTNTYLLGRSEVAVIDPGPDDDVHLQTLLACAGGDIRWILVTHTHRDHSPLAAKLAARTGAPLIGVPPPQDGRQDESFAPQRVPTDHELLDFGTLQLTAIRTPGHASNCVCYLLQNAKLLFTGDHVLEGVTPVILPPDGNMADYLHSVQKLMSLDIERIAPGHGGVIADAKRVLETLRTHRMMREAKVLSRLRAAGSSSIAALTPLVYDDVPKERHQWASLTLEAHLIKLAADGRVESQNGVWRALTVAGA
jgi:glyoxylase-like metal-dependent hydrolase (beta-lactamase superfamily II)